MTTQLSHPTVAVSFSSPEDVQPSWRDHWLDKILLLGVAIGDAVSFWIALQAFNASATGWQMLIFVGAMTSAAVMTMHKGLRAGVQGPAGRPRTPAGVDAGGGVAVPGGCRFRGPGEFHRRVE